MPIEDLSLFFDTTSGGFATLATFTRAGDPVVTTAVIFNAPSQPLMLEGTEVEEAAVFLLATATTVADVRRRDAVAVNGASYSVERIHPDGTGLTIIYLSQV